MNQIVKPHRLTANFWLHEFECPCGCVMPTDVMLNVSILAHALQSGVRSHLGPTEITSGYRCSKHNRKIGGAVGSQHIYGKAADFKVQAPKDHVFRHYTAEYLYGWLEGAISWHAIPQGGIGLYEEYPLMIHYDIRGKEARWRT